MADYPDYRNGNNIHAHMLQNINAYWNANDTRDQALLRDTCGINHRSSNFPVVLLLHNGKYHRFRCRIESRYGHKLENRLYRDDCDNSCMLFCEGRLLKGREDYHVMYCRHDNLLFRNVSINWRPKLVRVRTRHDTLECCSWKSCNFTRIC